MEDFSDPLNVASSVVDAALTPFGLGGLDGGVVFSLVYVCVCVCFLLGCLGREGDEWCLRN